MRKHFLLLFLMALLPLAGWADGPFNLATVTTVRAVYPQGMQAIVYNAQDRSDIAWTFEYQKDGSTEWYAIDKTQCDIVFYYGAAGNTANPGNAVTPKNAGQYYVGIKAKEGATEYTANSEVPAAKRPGFVIQQFPMTIQADGTQKVYGDADPTTLTWDIVNQQSLPEPKENIAITFTYERAGAEAGTDDAERVNPYGYDLTCTATATNYRITVTGSPKLVITPATLKVFYNKDNGISKKIVVKYGTIAAGTALAGTTTDKVTFEGWKRNDEPAANAQWAFGTLTLTPTAVTANVGPNGDGTTTLVGKEAHYATIALSDVSSLSNYTISYQHPALYVQQATIENTTGAFTFAKDAHDEFTYDGDSHAATYTIKYGTVGGTQQTPTFTEIETLTAGEDYTIEWKYGDDADTHNNKWAGTYTAIIKAKTDNDGNFTGNYATAAEGVTLTADALKYEIGQRNITIIASMASKPYTGRAQNLTGATVQWVNVINADAAVNNVSDYFEAGFVGDAPVNVGTTYKVKASAKEAWNDNGNTLKINYNPSYPEKAFSVTALDATITASAQEVDYKDDASYTLPDNVASATTVAFTGVLELAATTTEGAVEDQTNILKAIKLSLDPNVPLTGTEDIANAIKVELMTEEEIDAKTGDAWTNEVKLAVKTALKNYNFTELNAGTLKIAKNAFTIYSVSKDITYGDAYTLNDFAFDVLEFDKSEITASKVSFYLKKGDKEWKTNDNLPHDVGAYDIILTLDQTGIPTGYKAPTYQYGQLKINPKTLYITPNALSLNEGVTEAILETLATVTYSGTEENDPGLVSWNGVKDKVKFEVKFYVQEGDGEAVVLYGDNNDKLKNPYVEDNHNNEYQHGLIVNAVDPDADEVLAGTYANANYTINLGDGYTDAKKYGKITVLGASDLVINGTDVKVLEKIELAQYVAANDNKYNVYVEGRDLVVDTWNVVVLPFDVTPYEFCEAIGRYAVFNTLKSVTGTNVKFGINLANMPANKPFLVKPEEKEGDAQDTYNRTIISLNGKKFENRKIAYPTDGIPVNKDYDGLEFTGTYKNITIDGASGIYVPQGGKFREFSSGTAPINSTVAYLKFVTTPGEQLDAPVITVEEADGSTTAISTIATDGVAVRAEGWYTINGIKLESVPTEKGVYINNGKKVVIK